MVQQDNDNLIKFISEQLACRGWKQNELAQRAGVSSGAMSMVMNGVKRPGWKFCLRIANAFNEQPEKIFRLAWLTEEYPRISGVEAELLGAEAELLCAYRKLSADNQQLILRMLKGVTVYQGEVLIG